MMFTNVHESYGAPAACSWTSVFIHSFMFTTRDFWLPNLPCSEISDQRNWLKTDYFVFLTCHSVERKTTARWAQVLSCFVLFFNFKEGVAVKNSEILEHGWSRTTCFFVCEQVNVHEHSFMFTSPNLQLWRHLFMNKLFMNIHLCSLH